MVAPTGHPPYLLILLAEHDHYAAELQEYFLKTEGFHVEVTLGSEAARQSFLENSPSLVVVELLISGGAGLSLCRFFKQERDVPVIAVSALAGRDQAIEAGADAFLLKPLEPLQFVSTVKDLPGLLRHRRYRDFGVLRGSRGDRQTGWPEGRRRAGGP